MEENIMIHPETGEILRRDIRTIEFSFKGKKFMVNMPGWYPEGNNDGIFTHEDLQISEKEIERLKALNKKSLNVEGFIFPKVAVV